MLLERVRFRVQVKAVVPTTLQSMDLPRQVRNVGSELLGNLRVSFALDHGQYRFQCRTWWVAVGGLVRTDLCGVFVCQGMYLCSEGCSRFCSDYCLGRPSRSFERYSVRVTLAILPLNRGYLFTHFCPLGPFGQKAPALHTDHQLIHRDASPLRKFKEPHTKKHG